MTIFVGGAELVLIRRDKQSPPKSSHRWTKAGKGLFKWKELPVKFEETEKLRNEIYENSSCYEQIPKAEPYEGYEDMENFTATVEDKHLAELVGVAIDGKGAFCRFRDMLAHHPEERESWVRFKDDRMEQKALEWHDDIGISLVEE